MTVSSGLRGSLTHSGVGYQAVNNLYNEIVLQDARLTAADTASPAVTAVTATSDGLTTGLIPSTANHVTVTSASANDIITLPTPVVGKVFVCWVGANGCEVRAVGTSITVNNVIVSATNEAAIPATTLFTMRCVSATAWILTAVDELGAVITAIVPDAV